MCEDVSVYDAGQINFVCDEVSGDDSTWFDPKVATRDATFDSAGDNNIIVRNDGTADTNIRADVKRLISHCSAPPISTPTEL